MSFRAPVKSADEFGELASDLNRFLDRLNQILEDLGDVLARATNKAVTGAAHEPLLSADWLAGHCQGKTA
ncbi:MAG: HAMP domain-containing protein [Proteobacteria bacterium]|nr:HAMP domain-containing protein [Pseudomonadota bacterium]